VRLAASSEVSAAARAFCFIWVSRSEIRSPAATATSIVETPRCSELVTASRAAERPRIRSAMAQIDPSSTALATFSPVLIRA
jgi:hypothetical protein